MREQGRGLRRKPFAQTLVHTLFIMSFHMSSCDTLPPLGIVMLTWCFNASLTSNIWPPPCIETVVTELPASNTMQRLHACASAKAEGRALCAWSAVSEKAKCQCSKFTRHELVSETATMPRTCEPHETAAVEHEPALMQLGP
jgi:hypothetical protein